MARSLTVGLLLAAIAGCSDRSGKAVVDDYPGGGGYKIIAVDGVSPVRASSSVVTVVPYVLVGPGSHTFKATTLRGSGRFTFNATVAADRRYRVVPTADGDLTLVEVRAQTANN